MTEKINKINNPLTIIAIFAALAEINATVAIGLIDKSLHYIFIWFIIGFPTVLVISFFLTLNFNTKVMYSPSDYKEDKSFMDSLFGNNYGEKNSKLTSELSNLSSELEQKINDKIAESFKDLNSTSTKLTPEEIEKLKTNIKRATDESIKEIRDESLLNLELKQKMLSFFPFPAYYVLIFAIMQSKSSSVKQLKKFSDDFYIPRNWETSAFPRLFGENIILGTETSFTINKDYKNDLDKWQLENNDLLKFLSKEYKKIEDVDDRDEKEKLRNKVSQTIVKMKF